jgi:putative endonuclease
MAIHRDAALLGKSGEELAAKYLQEKNYQILDRNWRVKEGEIDLVALSPEEVLIFVEVKTRSSDLFGDPLESIKPRKIYRIQRLALAWLAVHSNLGSPFRLDAIGILIARSGQYTIDHRIDIG